MLVIPLLILHGLLAMLLLGALTHQAIGMFWKARGNRSGFIDSVRGVRTTAYPNAVVVIYVTTFLLGATVYPHFRVDVRTIWDSEWPAGTGSFEIKEHWAATGLAMLSAYWSVWRNRVEETRVARNMLTLLLTLIVWSDFLLGHILNNVKGLS
jgi:hypothetical protein